MKVEVEPNVVRIRVTDAEAARINQGPTPVHGYASRGQWGTNVVRAMGFTVNDDRNLYPIVDANRGVANRGFSVTVFIRSGRIPREPGPIMAAAVFESPPQWADEDASVMHEHPYADELTAGGSHG